MAITGYQHPWRPVRVFMNSILLFAMVGRSLRLFLREVVLLTAAACAVARMAGCSAAWPLAALPLGLWAWCLLAALQRVEFVAGHRAGAKGYAGQVCENTVESMRALVAADNAPDGPLRDLHYVEIDVQETADGEIVVLHDFHLADAFPDRGPNTAPYRRLHAQLSSSSSSSPGGDSARPRGPLVKDVTSAQLATLHLAGRRGLHAPTLKQFLTAFRESQCRRPLVVEVKGLQSDAGRQHLLQLLREQQAYAAACARSHPEFANPRLGFLGVIAFPNYYAASFGEFGSPSWARWGAAFVAARLPVRCCFLEALSFLRGIPGAP